MFHLLVTLVAAVLAVGAVAAAWVGNRRGTDPALGDRTRRVARLLAPGGHLGFVVMAVGLWAEAWSRWLSLRSMAGEPTAATALERVALVLPGDVLVVAGVGFAIACWLVAAGVAALDRWG